GVAAMVLDLDHFKQLNDAHGHAAGDAVLRAVAESLTASVRPTDVLARTGGEELVVLGLVCDPGEAGGPAAAGGGGARPRRPPAPAQPHRGRAPGDRLGRRGAGPAGRRRGPQRGGLAA